MPGTITFKPLAASLNINKKADPYCTFILGEQSAAGKPSGMGGKNPHWEDAVSMHVEDQSTCIVELKDQKVSNPKKNFIGNFEIDVREIESTGKVRKWFTVVNKNKPAGEILVEASYLGDNKPDLSRPEESDKAAQGFVPPSLDPYRDSMQFNNIRTEGVNSIAKTAETNEFGDYTPEKQLFGDQKHQSGGGYIQQGNYYSGQQTSYGEAFPMAQKSVGFDQIPTIEEYAGLVLPRGNNPTDYARYMHQAFVPHRRETNLYDNPSVVEQAYQHAKRDDLHKHSVVTPTVRMVTKPSYAANQDLAFNAYACEKSLDDKHRDIEETSPISGRTFGSDTQDSSRNESLADIISREQDISKGVGMPTPHGNGGDPDSDHSAFRDIKNTKSDLYGTF